MMPNDDSAAPMGTPIRLRRYILTLIVFWTVAIAIVFTWEMFDERRQAFVEARNKAWSIWQKEDAVFRWVAAHGGIYIPAKGTMPPQTTEESAFKPDITTKSGGTLRSASPATIMHQIYGRDDATSVHHGRITSLQPVDLKNSPDPWETKALLALAAGQQEFSSEETDDGKQYLRLMRPLITESFCAACHVEEGRKVGEVRGGLSVAVPLAPIWAEHQSEIVHRIITYGGMWLLGLCGIAFLSRHLHRQIECRCVAETKLQEANELLERRVADRTAELAAANADLHNEVAERRQAEHWLLESEQRFRGFFEQGFVGMAILSPDLDWVEVNDRLCRMLGYTEEELLLKTWKELGHPDDLPAEEPHFRRLLAGIVPGFVIDRRFLCKDGKILSAGLSVHCLKSLDQKIDSLLIVVRDTPNHTQV